MANIVYELQEESKKFNLQLESSTEELHNSKIKKLNKQQVEHTKQTLKTAIDLQKINSKKYEKDKKRYKVIKKYGEVLRMVEKLLGLIPSDLNNLSTEELEEKLKELLSSRKKNEDQMIFVFYQNMVTDLLKNLTNIEKDFVNKRISASQAHKCVQESKKQIKEYYKEAPEILKPTIKDASYLVNLYEQSYNAFDNNNYSLPEPAIKTTELNSTHQAVFEKLNKDTNSLISNVNSLSYDLSNFEPQVDLSKLSKQLETTEHISRIDDWDIKQMDTAVNDLKSTTTTLTDKQIDLNHQNEKLEEKIKDLTLDSKELSSTSMKEISNETYIDTNIRVKSNTIQTQVMQEQLQDTEDDFLFGLIIASALLMDTQMCADQEFGETLAQDPKADTINMETNSITQGRNAAYTLQDQAKAMQELRIQQQRELLLKFNPNEQPKN